MNYKYLTLALSASALLSACSGDEFLESENNSAEAITFGTYVTTATRATVIDNAQLQKHSFGVNAYTHTTAWDGVMSTTATPDFMLLQQVSYSSASGWTYSPLKYWPANASTQVSFVAWAPYDKVTVSTKDETTAGAPLATYNFEDATTSKIDTAKMYDLVSAHSFNNSGASTQHNTVKFSFKHALSRVQIQAKTDQIYFDKTDAKKRTLFIIEDVTLSGDSLYTHGSFDLAADKWTSKLTTSNPAQNPSWSLINLMDTTDVHPYAIRNAELAAEKENAENKATTPYFNLKGFELGTDNKLHTLFEQTSDSLAQYLFLIPGMSTAVAGDGHITVTFTYKVITMDDRYAAGYVVENATNSVTIRQPIHQGYAYNWNFTFSRSGITFDGATTDWIQGETGGGQTPEYPGAGDGNINDVINVNYYLYNSKSYGWSTQQYAFTNKGNGLYSYTLTAPLEEFMIGDAAISAENLYGTKYSEYQGAVDYGHILSHSDTGSKKIDLVVKSDPTSNCHYIWPNSNDLPQAGDVLWFDPTNKQVWIVKGQ
jgi:hypothetical protein